MQSESWRKSKFRVLVENYILPGSNLEVNISHKMRDEIVSTYESSSVPKDLFSIFDAAYNEIERLLEQGVWGTFYLRLEESGGGINGSKAKHIVVSSKA